MIVMTRSLSNILIALITKKLKPEERERYRKLLRELQIDRDRINRNYWNSIRDIERFKYDHGLK